VKSNLTTKTIFHAKWKKALIITLLATILQTATLNIVYASPTILSIDPSSILDPTMIPSTQFTIDITVDDIKELWGYQFTMSFNPDVLHGVSVENGPFLGSEGGSVLVAPGEGFDNEAGTLGLFGAALYPKRFFPTGGGILAYITFHVVG